MSFGQFLNPRNDLVFKRIFGTEKNKDILIHFLNDIFARTTNPIEDVTFLKSAQSPEIAAQRVSIVDVMCQDTEGNRFIVEIQVVYEPSFTKRAQYYAAKAYIEQRSYGTEYQDLKQVTFLAITNFTLFPDKPTYLSHHQILDTTSYEHDLQDFSFSFLELPKFTKPKEQLKTVVERWAYFFKHGQTTHKTDLDDIVGNDQIIYRAYEELNRYGWSAEELRVYDSVDMKLWSDKAILEGVFDQGKQQGIKIMVTRLLASGMDRQQVANLTELNLEQVIALESSNTLTQT